MKNIISKMIIITVYLFVISCEEDSLEDTRELFFKPVNPSSQPSELSRILKIEGANITGDIPESNSANSPQLLIVQERASITPDNELFLPFTFKSEADIERMYLLVQGADNYWNVPIDPGENQGYVLDVGIPNNVADGSFSLNYKLEDSRGSIGNQKNIDVQVVSYQNGCDDGSYPLVEGNDGLSVRSYLFGDQPGTIRVFYETFSVPDRVDIRYGDQWFGVTGEPLNGKTPPIKLCNDVTAGDGFLGTTGIVEIPYDPSYSKRIDIYISGCLQGGTAWNFQVTCPDVEEEEEEEEGFEGLPDCPCNYSDFSDGEETTAPAGTWLKCDEASQTYHFGATSEARWVPDELGAAGQQCTYDSKGSLITGGIAAGSPDLVSPRACGYLDGIFSPTSWIYANEHKKKDVIPWNTKSCLYYLSNWPANGGNCGNPNIISGIDHMHILVDGMTCKQITALLNGATNSNSLSEELKSYLLGNSRMSYSQEQLVGWLTDWKASQSCNNSGNSDVSDLCSVIDEAIANLKD